MKSNSAVRLRTSLDSYNLAVINGAQLILALEDLGYDNVTVDTIDGGFALLIDGIQIAVGVGDDAIEASEELLDRAADLFYYSTPEA
jgi:uncharacterized protein GlcG (DUF336 family)|tara:strand:- start:21 stop:281 length:261 start_codon:yes stop_codon:yes gene_type:complete